MAQQHDVERLNEAKALADTLASMWALSTYISRTTAGLPTLPTAQASAFRRIVGAGEHGIMPSELAAAMGVSRAMASDHIRRLEEQGLVTRQRAEADGRSVLVTSTEHGRTVHRTFHPGIAHAMAEAMPMLSARERHQLERSIGAIERLQGHLTAIADRVGTADAAPTGPEAFRVG